MGKAGSQQEIDAAFSTMAAQTQSGALRGGTASIVIVGENVAPYHILPPQTHKLATKPITCCEAY